MQKRFISWMTDPAVWAAWRRQLRDVVTTPWGGRDVSARSAELFPRFAAVYHKLRSLPRRMRRQLQRQWACSLAGVAFALVLTPNASWAANFSASTAAELTAAIDNANGNVDADTITLLANITLTERLPIVNSTITIVGNGHTIARQSGTPLAFRPLEVQAPGVVTIQETTLSGGNDPYNGGGIYNGGGTVTLTNSTVSGNTAGRSGGGIFNNGGTLTLTNSTVSGNTAGTSYYDYSNHGGGGIFNNGGTVTLTNSTVSGNTVRRSYYNVSNGGGIYTNGGTVTLTNSTVSGNTASFGGGGIFTNGGSVTLTNSTVSGNATTYGGGIFNGGGDVIMTNSTVSGNATSATYGGGGVFNGGGTMTLTNSLISGNSAKVFGAEIRNLSTISSSTNLLGHNGLTNAQAFSGFTPTSGTDITATSDGTAPTALGAILDPTLANNGGPTLTHALVTGSPAIDAGDDVFCPETDQRGVQRPFGSQCDIGAVEFVVPFAFTGFFQPVDNGGIVNQVKAGQSIPVKFSLGGNFGLDVLADNSPSSQQIGCTSGVLIDDIEETVTSGASSLTYDTTTNQYKYVWKTQKAWAGTCRQLTVTLTDGSVHTALFKLK